MGYRVYNVTPGVKLIQETGVASFMRCNIWLVQGRDHDLVIDTGMGLDSLKSRIIEHTSRPIKAVVTHCHFDHSGCLHEFDSRLGHPLEASILENPEQQRVVFSGAWTRIGIVDLHQHPDYSAATYHVTPAPLTAHLDEGDVVDLGNRVFQILHLPGHSPGSIGLWDAANKVLFSGDALYDGELLDSLYHSNLDDYNNTLDRIESLGAQVFHAGHFPSFGTERMTSLISEYRAGRNSLGSVELWFEQNQHLMKDIFGEQNWSASVTPIQINADL